MERAAALRKIAKLLGNKMRYRVDANAPTNEQRQEAESKLSTAVAERNKLRDAREARKQALLDADSEYQRLLAESSAASKQVDHLHSLCHHFKFEVGTMDSIFFHIKAQGDSWEEIIAKLEKEQSDRRAHIARATK